MRPPPREEGRIIIHLDCGRIYLTLNLLLKVSIVPADITDSGKLFHVFTLTCLNPNPVTDPNPNPKNNNNKNENDTGLLNIELYLKVDLLGTGVGL